MLKEKYTEKDVANLIAQVEEAFTSQLAKAETSLAKSEDGESHKEERKEEHEEKPEHEAKDSESEAHEGKDEHGKEGEDHEGHDYDEEDMAHMEKMYRSMSKGEQKAHHDCLSKCMGMDKSGLSPGEIKAKMAKGEDGIESCEPKNTPGAKSPASKAEGMQMKKADGSGGEMSDCEPHNTPGAKSPASKEQGSGSEGPKSMAKTETGKIESCEPKNTPGAKSPASKAEGMQMEKSENTEVELLKSELETQKKQFEAVQEFLTKLVKKTAPQGKAITSLDVIAKSETHVEEKTLSKGEIHEVLKAKSADASLKKSDRDAINAFYLTGQVNVNSISHLLK